MRKILSLCAAFLFAAGMLADPVVLPATLDVSNVSFRSENLPDFVLADGDYAGTYLDMGAHDSSNDTALYAEWDVTIQPIKYNVAVDVYNTNSWTVQILLLNQTGAVVKTLDYHGHSGDKGQFSAGSMDLSDLAAGNYKVRAHSIYAWSALKVKDVIFAADYQGVSVALPGTLQPAYAELSSGASLANGAIAFAPSTANNEYAIWNVSFAEAGNYSVAIDMTAPNGHTYGVALLSADGQTGIDTVAEAQAWDTGVKELGVIAVPVAGNYKVKLTNATQWSEAVINSITFTAPIGAPAYYLVGTMNNWTEADAYKFVANPETEGEYMLSTTLAEGDSLKVIGIVGNTTTWYPAQGANYGVDAAHAGEKTVYFRPDGQGGNDWYYGVIYIAPNENAVVFTKADFAGQGTSSSGSPVTATKDGVTFNYSKGYCADESLRCYAHGALEITSAEYLIEKINFTTTGGKDGGLPTEVTVNAASYSVADLASQARFTEIKVTLGDPIPAPVEVHYYMKNNWNEGDWAWKEMTKDGDNYKLDSVVFGGTGVNYNTAASDEGAVWVELAKIAGATIAAKDTVSFVLNPADSTVTATLIGKYVEPVVPVIASPYCNTEVGHLFLENPDPNSYVLLSIGAKDGKTIVRIDQDAAKNNQKFDYLQVTGLASAGADVAEGGATAMAVAFDTPTAANDSITLEILWSTVNWDGRWMVQNVKVPAAAVCEYAELVHTYTVAGDLVDAFGTAWTPDLAANDMVKAEGDSLYRWEKAELLLAAGSSIAFKVCEDHAWTVAYPAENYVLNIAKAAIYTVKITFNPATKAVAAEAVKTGDAPLAEILFTEAITADQLPADTTFVLPNSEFKMQITDPDNKMSIDANACRFGVAKEYKMYSHRLKSGGKSSATKNFMTVTIPQEGTLRLAVRTGSNSATDRNLVVMQGEDTLLNQILLESQAIKVMEDTVEVSVYPYINVPVEAGSVVLSYPVNALNFYAFAFEPEPDHTYTVAGDSEAAFGAAWTPSREANDMVKAEGDSLYRWTKADITLAAGKIQFKVCEDHAWAHAWPAQNYELNIDKSGIYTIKITFDKKTKAVAAEAVLQQEIKVIPTIKMHGNFTGSWTNTALFELAADSLTASLKMNIAAGNYEFGMRIGGDGNWTSNGAQFTRENPSAKVVAGQGNLKLAADIAGEYTFTWFFDEDSLAIAYPKIIPHYNVAEAIAAELLENDEIFVRGVITKIEFKGKNFAKYGSANIYVADATGAEGAFEFYNCYSMNADTFKTSDPAYDATSESWKQFQSVTDGNGVEVAVGDTVEAFGKFKLYNTTYELNTGCYITNIKKPVIPADYYLVGTMNNWTPDSAYMFIVNPENDAEYMLAATLAPADELKVIGIAGKDTTWYPANAGNYVVDSLHAGEKVVYFRPDGQGGSDWYNGVIFIKENEPVWENPIDTVIFNTRNWAGKDTLSTVTWDAENQKVIVNIIPGKNAQWQAQLWLKLPMEVRAGYEYDLAFTAKANKTFDGTIVKYQESAEMLIDWNMALVANEPLVYEKKNMRGLANGNGVLVLDFGFVPDSTLIEIYNMSIIEHEPTTPIANFYVTGNDAFTVDAGKTTDFSWHPDAFPSYSDTLTLSLKAGAEYQFKVCVDGSWNTVKDYNALTEKTPGLIDADGNNHNIGFKLAEDGDVMIIYNAEVFKVVGNFVTEDIDNIFDAEKAVKVLRDGQIYIIRGDKVYTVMGQLK